jgi:hypothetical protein
MIATWPTSQNPSKRKQLHSWGLISTLDIWYNVSRTILRTFGDLDKEHKGGREPDFSPLLLQDNRRILFYLFLSFLSGINVAKKLTKLFFGR